MARYLFSKPKRAPEHECAYYLDLEQFRRLITGQVLKCETCGSKIWMDDQSFFQDARYHPVWYRNKCVYLDLWTLKGFFPDVRTNEKGHVIPGPWSLKRQKEIRQ